MLAGSKRKGRFLLGRIERTQLLQRLQLIQGRDDLFRNEVEYRGNKSLLNFFSAGEGGENSRKNSIFSRGEAEGEAEWGYMRHYQGK